MYVVLISWALAEKQLKVASMRLEFLLVISLP